MAEFKTIGKPGRSPKIKGLLLEAVWETQDLRSDIYYDILSAFGTTTDYLVRVTDSDNYGLNVVTEFEQASRQWSSADWDNDYSKRDQDGITSLFNYAFNESVSCDPGDVILDSRLFQFFVSSDGTSSYAVQMRQDEGLNPITIASCVTQLLRTTALYHFPDKDGVEELDGFFPGNTSHLKSWRTL